MRNNKNTSHSSFLSIFNFRLHASAEKLHFVQLYGKADILRGRFIFYNTDCANEQTWSLWSVWLDITNSVKRHRSRGENVSSFALFDWLPLNGACSSRGYPMNLFSIVIYGISEIFKRFFVAYYIMFLRLKWRVWAEKKEKGGRRKIKRIDMRY